MVYGRRSWPYGVRALVSRDAGSTWDYDNKLTLVSESTHIDCGYPSGVQNDDGTIFVAYYTFESLGPFIDPSFEKYGPFRAAGWQRAGIHCAGVKLLESDLP